MAYLFKQKLRLADLATAERPLPRVLIFEPEEYLAALYGFYLSQHNVEVRHCLALDSLLQQLASFLPRLLVFNAEAAASSGLKHYWLSRCRRDFPELLIVSTAYNADSRRVGDLMDAGVCSHLNRQHSRPQDLALVVMALLQN